MDSNNNEMYVIWKAESTGFASFKVNRDSYNVIISENRKKMKECLIKYFDSFIDNYVSNGANDLFNDVFNRCKQLVDDMYNNLDSRYFDLLCNKLFDKTQLLCCNFDVEDYLKKLKNGKRDNYIFVLYSCLYGYSLNKNCYDKYETLLSDIPFMMLYAETWDNSFNSYDDFSSKVSLLENIIGYKNYFNNPGLRKALNDILWFWNSIVVNMIEVGHRVLDLEDFFDYVSYIGEDGIDSNIDLILNDVVNRGLVSLYPIFYYGRRYEYLSSLEIEDNDNLKKDILIKIAELNIDLFNDLNIGREKDSFISCMDIVFDSDSYDEVISKLELLKKVSYLYRVDEKKEEALELLKKLDDESHKKIFCGKKVSYQKTMNKVVKPKRIIDRMKDLYGKIDSSISYDFMDDVHLSANTVKELCENVDCCIEKEMLPMNRLKRKVKSFFKKSN